MILDRLRLGITQRRIAEAPKAWARDALDAHWGDWLASCWPRSRFLAIPNFSDPVLAVRHVVEWDINLLVLGGGEDLGVSPERDAVERALLNHARARSMPVIGVCRGMQMLHAADGGELVQCTGHVGSPHPLQGMVPAGTCVNSWHHRCIEHPGPQWQVLAHAPGGSVEAMRHGQLPWLGLMWHPERLGGSFPAMWEWINDIIANTRRDA